MAEGIYRLEYLRERVLRCLRGQKAAVSRDALCVETGLPAWAVDAALELLLVQGLAVFAAGSGWWVQAQPAVQQREVCGG